MVAFGGTAREKFVHSLGNILAPRGVSPTNVGRRKSMPKIDAYFQQRAITGSDIEKIFGDADTFLKRYEKFEAKYHKALETELKGGQRNRLLADLSKERGTLDFNLLNRDVADSLLHEYKTEVLKLDHVLHAHGAPTYQIPSGNAFRTLWMFDIEHKNGMQHPAQILYSKLMINHNAEKTGMETISIGRSGILSSSMFRNLWEQYKIDPKNVKPIGELKPGQKVITFDTESTGISRYSETRSMAASMQVVDNNGVLSVPEKIEVVNPVTGEIKGANIGFKSNQFNNYTVGSPSGQTRTVNEFIQVSEQFPELHEFGVGGEEFLDKSTEFIQTLLGADKIVAHNAAYDLDMLTQTMINQPNFHKHVNAQNAIIDLREKIKTGDYLFDTLDPARIYLRGQAEELMGRKRTARLSSEYESDLFVESLFSGETRASVRIGGNATYSGVEDIAIGTNLFELIEAENGNAATDVFEKISSGSHIADTDIHIQSYITKYIEEKKLKIIELAQRDGEALTEFGKFSRAKVAKSVATTLTSNIKDINNLSLENINYLLGEGIANQSTTKGLTEATSRLKGVSIKVEAGTVIGKHKVTEDGFLKFHDGSFKLFTGKGKAKKVLKKDAVEHIQDTIREALHGDQQTTLNVAGTSQPLVRNLANERINNLGISIGTASTADAMRRIRSLTRPTTDLNKNTILEGLAAPYEHATGFSVGQRLQTITSPEKKISPFQRGVKEISETASHDMANKMMTIGNQYAGVLSPNEINFGTVLAESTADVTKMAGKNVIKGSEEVLAHTKYAEQLASLGMASFRKQETTRLFQFADQSGSILARSKPMVHSDIIAHIFKQAGAQGKKTHLQNVPLLAGLSTVEYGGVPRVNLFLDVDEQFGAKGSRELAERLIDLHLDDSAGSAHSKIAAALGVEEKHLTDSAKEAATQVQIAVSNLGRQGAVDQLTEHIRERGIVYGNVENAPAAAIIDNLAGMGMDITNEEVGAQMRGYVPETHSESIITSVGWHDRQASQIAGTAQEIQDIAHGTEVINGRRVSSAHSAAKQIVENLDKTGDLDSVMRRVSKARDGFGTGSLVEFYNANKKNAGKALAAVAAIGTGYYLYKRHKERKLYNETFDGQPTERNRGVRIMNSSASNQTKFNNDISNPLATAGIVGNLDRMKIGHTRMGNNKHAHLFGG